MKRALCAVGRVALCLTWVTLAHAGTLKCPPDSVKVGTACIDLYEASVWQIPPSNTALVEKVQAGKVTLADLTGGGGTPLGCFGGQGAYPANFPKDGNWTPVLGSGPPSPGVYAVSIAGVLPSTCTSWFQAVQACAVSGKRLIRNEEWQRAAAGTPDPGNADDGSTTCVTNSGGPANTGSRSACKSSWGVFDMVGNVWEWVADWADKTFYSDINSCTDWTTSAGVAGGDVSCFGGSGGGGSAAALPAALIRGGLWESHTAAGVFAVSASFDPSYSNDGFGFRCAR